MPMSKAMYHDRNDESEAELRTITLSDSDLRAAARLLNLLSGREADDVKGFDSQLLAERSGGADRAILTERAHREFIERQRRSTVFSNAMFGEPAWDMLLALYATGQSGVRFTIARL